jgi:branched-chain amino acid transport system ATP-binding protein
VSTEDREVLLRFDGVDTHYGPVHVLKSIDMVVHEGELVSLLGGNASGKTTTLKTILSMVQPTNGRCHRRRDGHQGWTTKRRRSVACRWSRRTGGCSSA